MVPAARRRVGEEYVEPGASGTDENRPLFQDMLAHARSKPRPFDILLVHSFSRFCRDEFTYAAAQRDLGRAGISLQSITQPLGDDHTGKMVGQILVAFDAYQSRENGKHTSRAMKENARQGFWNGSVPPFGYRTVEAGRRARRSKRFWVSSNRKLSSSGSSTACIWVWKVANMASRQS
jgi:DNA invertase Pin-like site-specific DNA recombinase